ncbi:2,3-dihydro-2,3-dihydroxybenzoate dehydrogenase [Nonomuraea dietziae]|uniref:2,3-dihydro-2,3-dihydroxybenzoate dehydrogenase n=1 Tax=Nonomuraea dietziae TaxID=65515 RepID=A0A7W5VSS7_9ACTN|nr:2,3-dihydro-2,3-dihydroxybenzoate dehydrogenase [Nonomuraea dietziae]MBB3733847.1 2,3-dihydro-2,3-dihydroxybenzoate dehydrogenase [Nonomuraea dietziae]
MSTREASRHDGIDGKVALVTGAGRGIGAAVTDALLAAGATVAAADLLIQPSTPHGAVPYLLDVRDAGEVDDVVAAVERDLGPIDILVNVAGVLLPGSVQDTDLDQWQQTIAVNASGVFLVSRAVTARMVPRGCGAIVTVSSNAASTPRMGMAAYAASKAAATAFTRCLGLELAGHGIRCNVVSPGSTDTDMLRALHDGTTLAEAWKTTINGDLTTYRLGIPLGRVAAPHDIADAVLYLASDRARHVTMHDLVVDGGATLRA